MSVLVVGLSHHTAPIELLERAALGAEGARDLAARKPPPREVTGP